MENPCNKCIIKVNCTEVCLPKRNYGILLEQSSSEHFKVKNLNPQNSYYQNQYRKIQKKLGNHRTDESIIYMRSMEAKIGF